ncbi:Tyrosine--tRNA ligase cytoplasmic [Brettanomyces bruxellensis]|uniref:Tyrosine--tRNA ligase n=1 Tax=Dekkera bruxellensis TaxID=5007 RepID=A0A8H6EWL7_DEKBR|nr:Tyrosine--tRNA ligase cytoplasmic [Brettanomyces bruxellensis]
MSNVVEDPKEKYTLITKGLQEVLNGQIIKKVLEEEKRPLKIYWGTAPTGKPHCGYFVPMIKLAHFLKAGCEVKVLLADLHAFLDNMKAPLDVVNYRAKYYEFIVKAILRSIGVPIEKLTFVVGSSYQLSRDYTLDLFKLANIVSQNDAKRAGADVVKQVANPLLSGLIYPLMQVLDEQYLDVDAEFGGVDQRKIFVLSEENIEALGYKKRAHMMNPMVPGLGQGGKMSSSDPNSKIDIIEKPKRLRRRSTVQENGLLSFVQFVLGPVYELKHGTGTFQFFIDRPEKYGGPITYNSFEDLKTAFKEEKLSPVDLKAGVAAGINQLLEPIIAEYEANPEFQEAAAKGYPEPSKNNKQKKQKKQKNRGSRYPGKKDEEKETEKVSKKLEEAKIEN